MMVKILSFLFRGQVQGVKFRRYVEAAGKYFDVGGYVINLEEEESGDGGDVFGEAWVHVGVDGDVDGRCRNLNDFENWIWGEHRPAEYTNMKPTPVGPAYPALAKVERFATTIKRISTTTTTDTDDTVVVMPERNFYCHERFKYTNNGGNTIAPIPPV